MGIGDLASAIKKKIAYKPLQPYKKTAETKIEKLDFMAGLISYGIRIILRGINTQTVYTVPDGKTFFLVGLSATALSGVNSGTRGIVREGTTGSRNLLEVVTATLPGTTSDDREANGSISFSIPIRFNSGEIIQNTTNNGTTTCTIVGYEVPTAVLPLFT